MYIHSLINIDIDIAYVYIYIYMLEQEMVDQIYREMDIPVHKGDAGGGIDESIDEDL